MIKARISKSNIKTVLCGIGMPDSVSDPAFLARIEKLLELACQTAKPKLVYRILGIRSEENGIRIEGTDTVLSGNDIQKHLSGCEKAAFLALTLGTEPEKLLLRSDPADALILDGCFSVLTEQACDSFETDLREKLLGSGLFLTGRFSPGYGDLPILLQNDLLNILNAERTAGLTVSGSGILLPRKSVTAILGVSEHRAAGYLAGCENCAIKERCSYRKEGKTCGNR